MENSIAKILLESEAVKVSLENPFTWTTGIKSPLYCDHRIMISFPEKREIIVNQFIEKMKELNLNPDVIAGTATGGIPWASFIAQKMELPMVYVKADDKEHGTKKRVEGIIQKDQKVILIEDLVSTGGSAIRAIKALKEETRAQFIGCMVMVNWELDICIKNFSNANISFHSLTNLTEVAQAASFLGKISPNHISGILSFRKDPQTWYQNCFG